MTDAPSPRQPSGETLPPAEDETRILFFVPVGMMAPLTGRLGFLSVDRAFQSYYRST
jgi:hypothetical protein